MSFSKDFIFSCSTASYQIEGSWDADGKGENIWDRITHTNTNFVRNQENGDIACDSYNLYKTDVQLVKQIGFGMYRFSISWARILPDGDITNINSAGVDYYHKLIDESLKNGIQPMVTMYHWDLPQKLQDIGGWMNPLIVDYMSDYADLLFKLYGEKVKWWITLNEPMKFVEGYESDYFAPALNLDSPANYIVVHHALIAHGTIFKLYNDKYRSKQQGKISISLNSSHLTEKTNSAADVEATNRAWAFQLDWIAHPIYSKEGGYSKVIREVVDENSRQEGRNRSRLPNFTVEESEVIKGSFDFFALNHYTTRIVSATKEPFSRTYYRDMNVNFEFDPRAPVGSTPWMSVVPWGFRGLLCWIKDQYGNPPVFITENGYCDSGGLNDVQRINYFQEYITEMHRAIEEFGCNVIGYTVWSLLDNFEWKYGYEMRFGIVHVDYNDSKRKRTLKKSAEFFKQLIATKIIPSKRIDADSRISQTSL